MGENFKSRKDFISGTDFKSGEDFRSRENFKLRDSKTTEDKPKKGRNVPPAPVNMKMISLKERGLCSELYKRAS